MAYTNFSLAKVKEEFDLTFTENQNIFAQVEPANSSEILSLLLADYILLATAINTEKARSELLISQILTEVRRQLNAQVSLFSGTDFNVDEELGLNGYCDFIISASSEQYFISTPVIIVVEAKNENIIGGLGQCVATMLGAQLFNQRADHEIPIIYGAVTTGTIWKFLTLAEKSVLIDAVDYHIKEVDKILGILLQPIQQYLSTHVA